MNPTVRTLLALVLGIVIGVALIGLRNSSWRLPAPGAPKTLVGTTGIVDTDKAREQGARLGEKAAEATRKVEETIGEAALTTKIKAKMALDDSVRARAIDVSTTGSVVTLDGVVRTVPEHDRAIMLARETSGVTDVVDHLAVRTQ